MYDNQPSQRKVHSSPCRQVQTAEFECLLASEPSEPSASLNPQGCSLHQSLWTHFLLFLSSMMGELLHFSFWWPGQVFDFPLAPWLTSCNMPVLYMCLYTQLLSGCSDLSSDWLGSSSDGFAGALWGTALHCSQLWCSLLINHGSCLPEFSPDHGLKLVNNLGWKHWLSMLVDSEPWNSAYHG